VVSFFVIDNVIAIVCQKNNQTKSDVDSVPMLPMLTPNNIAILYKEMAKTSFNLLY